MAMSIETENIGNAKVENESFLQGVTAKYGPFNMHGLNNYFINDLIS